MKHTTLSHSTIDLMHNGKFQKTSSLRSRSEIRGNNKEHAVILPPVVKKTYLYRGGDHAVDGVRLAIHQNRYRSLEALLRDLTENMPDSTDRIETVNTLRRGDKMNSLVDLTRDGHYICSERPIGTCQGNKTRLSPMWRSNNLKQSSYKPMKYYSSTRIKHTMMVDDVYALSNQNPGSNTTLGSTNSVSSSMAREYAARPDLFDSEVTRWSPWKPFDRARRVSVRLNGGHQKKVFLIRRKHICSMKQMLQEMSELFGVPIYRVYSLDGRLMRSVEEMVYGPEEFIATGLERFRPTYAVDHLPGTNMSTRLKTRRNGSKTGSQGALNKRTWRVYVNTLRQHPETGQEYTQACTSNILLTVCGRNHVSQSVLLRPCYVKTLDENDGYLSSAEDVPKVQTGPFQPGRTDRFDITLDSVFSVEKIRISHDATGSYPHCLLGEIRLQSMKKFSRSPVTTAPGLNSVGTTSNSLTKGVEITFTAVKWLSYQRGEGFVVREIAAPDRPTVKSRVPCYRNSLTAFLHSDRTSVCQYEVTVVTGQLWNSATSGRVHIQLYGDRGNSGTRLLWNAEVVNGTAFLRGKMSVFLLEAVHLGRLLRLSLWLEGGTKPWYLEEIFVQEFNGSTTDSIQAPLMHEKLTSRDALMERQRRITSFSHHQWVDSQNGREPTAIQLIASELNIKDASPLQEDLWWEAEQWKFCPGTEVIFYSQLTGAPLHVRTGSRLVAEPIKDHEMGMFTCLVFQVEPGCQNSGTRLLLKPRSVPTRIRGRKLEESQELQKDIERFNEEFAQSSSIRRFSVLSAPGLELALGETGGMCLSEQSPSEEECNSPAHDFRIRGRPDRCIILESAKVSSAGAKYHAYVGPGGRVISAACGPLSMPGKLLIPYVKGILRDSSIIWLCTSLKQTLGPCLREKNATSGLTNNLWSLDVSAAEERSSESYWRVIKVGRGQRQFEAVAWPGHYLQMANDRIDIMGNRECSESVFTITRVREKGFIRISPTNDVNKLIGIQEDGQLMVYSNKKASVFESYDLEDRTRFYPEVIVTGVPSQPKQIVANSETQKDTHQVTAQQSVPSVSTTSDRRKLLKARQQRMPVGEECIQPDKERESNSCDESSLDETGLPHSPAPSLDRPDTSNNWKITLLTEKNAKNCDVILVVYGHNGNSGPILIGQSDDGKQLFRENSIDTFMASFPSRGQPEAIKLKNLGQIFKIRFEVSQIHKDEDMEWQLQEATLDNEDTGVCYTFNFEKRPFLRTTSLCCMSREQCATTMATSRQSLTDSITSESSVLTDTSRASAEAWRVGLVSYPVSIELLTGPPGWTDHRELLEPHLSLVGCFGDSGRRLVPSTQSTVSDGKQAAEQVTVLRTSIECIYLGDLSLCLFGPVDVTNRPDQARSGPMCIRLLVQDPIARVRYCFPARIWLLGERKQSIHEVQLSVSEVLHDASTLSSDAEKTENSSLFQEESKR